MTPAAMLRPSPPIRSSAGKNEGASADAMAITTTSPTSGTLKAISQRLRFDVLVIRNKQTDQVLKLRDWQLLPS
jgi:hypothetical protein